VTHGRHACRVRVLDRLGPDAGDPSALSVDTDAVAGAGETPTRGAAGR